jgi:hypothetical protein
VSATELTRRSPGAINTLYLEAAGLAWQVVQARFGELVVPTIGFRKEVHMNRFRVVAVIVCFALVALACPLGAIADQWNRKTTVTFNKPVEIPGVGAQILPAGTYVFKLFDSMSDRHIVQIFNERGDHIYATILAIPNYRLRATDQTVMTFGERAAGSPQAIRAWFYPGNNWGQEFVYPKKRAVELAKLTNTPVLAMPSELAENITLPVRSVDDQPVIVLKQAPLEAVKPTGEEVAISEVVEAPPAQTADAVRTPEVDRALPHTASPLPLVGLIGILALATAGILWVIPQRPA